jgi:tetratricopeptide (TPR) repeat protein
LLARLYAQTGEEAKAVALYESVVESGESLPSARNDLAFLLARRGSDLDRALQLAQQAYQALPQDPEVLDTLGYVFLRRGLPEVASAHLRKAVDLAEEQGTPRATHYYHLGLALRLGRQNRSAVEAFDRCLSLDPDFPEAEDARRQREAALAGAPPPLDLF